MILINKRSRILKDREFLKIENYKNRELQRLRILRDRELQRSRITKIEISFC